MNAFSTILENEVNLKKKKNNSFISCRCKFSHLLFVDDLLVVGVTNPPTTCFLKYALDNLASYMGLVTNKNKSIIYFSSKKFVPLTTLRNPLMSKIEIFLKYLGLPLVARVFKAIHFNVLFDKRFS